MLFAFQNMNDPASPFADLVPGRSAERFLSTEWWDHPDQMVWFMQLASRSLNKLTGRHGLMLDKDHHRYYFPPKILGEELEIDYRPLNQKTACRKVVWQRHSKRTGEPRGYWYHRAVALRFLRVSTEKWYLSIRPELRVTSDGSTPLPSSKIGARVTREQSRRFNYDVLSEVNFWRDYLSNATPRIIMSFGPNQFIVISTTLANGQVVWPGIPEEHAKEFKNVQYIDTLFTWAELAQLDSTPDDDFEEDLRWEEVDESDSDR
jgi:hypothetical protein